MLQIFQYCVNNFLLIIPCFNKKKLALNFHAYYCYKFLHFIPYFVTKYYTLLDILFYAKWLLQVCAHYSMLFS